MAVVRAVILDTTLQVIGLLFLFCFFGKVFPEILRQLEVEVIYK
jgi:hypothetical protein